MQLMIDISAVIDDGRLAQYLFSILDKSQGIFHATSFVRSLINRCNVGIRQEKIHIFSFTFKIRIFSHMIKVAVGIIRENGNVLVCQRKQSARYGLRWEFPGGKVENGETTIDCLKRELKEELNIDAQIGSLYHRQEYTYADAGSFEVFYYIVSSYHGKLENRAFGVTRWIPENCLGEIDMLEGNREVVEKIAIELRGDSPLSAGSST
jgi:8-oxo-dGTP diphosphatase